MPVREFEYLLAEHCAPTLLSRKCASLVSLSRRSFPDLSFLPAYERCLSDFGISCRILKSCEHGRLLLLYRRDPLTEALFAPNARHILSRFGYPSAKSLDALISHLEQRLRFCKTDFPHEIGLFLGYPPEDVEAFIRHRGAGCKLCGYWKVYCDVEAAKKQFAVFDGCRAFLCSLLQNGTLISSLLSAA